MIETVFLTAIINPKRSKQFEQFFIENKTPLLLWTGGRGTASTDILDYLGIGESDKEIIFTVLSKAKAKRMLKSMDKKMQLYIPGNGIAFAVPLCSFAGATALQQVCGASTERLLQESATNSQEEEGPMEQYQYQLIVAIISRGYVDAAMDAAREASARGGTVIHALGTGNKHIEQFFGISIAQERDMIFIVSTTAAKDNIMKAIVAEMGKATKSHAIVFSLPINDIVGLRLLEDEENEATEDEENEPVSEQPAE